MIRAANQIATAPYKYGGGHGSFHDCGYDCSGIDLLRAPRRRPAAARSTRAGFMRYGAPGRGRYITIYANPGHAYMVVDGRRFDTSARFETGSRWTNTMRSSNGLRGRHPPGL